MLKQSARLSVFMVSSSLLVVGQQQPSHRGSAAASLRCATSVGP